MSDTTTEAAKKKPKPSKKAKKSPTKVKRRNVSSAKITAENLAALIDKGKLEIEGTDYDLHLRLANIDEDDLEDLKSAHEDLGIIIDQIEDDDYDDDDDEDDDEDDDDIEGDDDEEDDEELDDEED